eukprot:s410_g6.t1
MSGPLFIRMLFVEVITASLAEGRALLIFRENAITIGKSPTVSRFLLLWTAGTTWSTGSGGESWHGQTSGPTRPERETRKELREGSRGQKRAPRENDRTRSAGGAPRRWTRTAKGDATLQAEETCARSLGNCSCHVQQHLPKPYSAGEPSP